MSCITVQQDPAIEYKAIVDIRLCPGAAPLPSHFVHYAFFASPMQRPLCANVTSSTKPEVHIGLVTPPDEDRVKAKGHRHRKLGEAWTSVFTARRYASAGICHGISVCVSVCVSHTCFVSKLIFYYVLLNTLHIYRDFAGQRL